jgi:hypothetical protein
MKNKIVYTLLISYLLFTASTPLYATTNSYADNELANEQHIWQGAGQEPQTSSIGADPGIPEVPLDKHMIILVLMVAFYGYWIAKRSVLEKGA